MCQDVRQMISPGRQDWACSGFAALIAFAILTVSVATPTRAGTLDVGAGADANVYDNTGTGVFTQVVSASNGLDIRDFAGVSPDFEHRAVIQFGQFTLPANVVVTGVTFNFDASSITDQQSRIVNIEGYNSVAPISTADATAPATLLGSYDNFALGLGNHSVDLRPAAIALIQSLSGSQNPVLGLRLQGDAYGVNTTIYSIEQAGSLGVTPPSLTITFSSVPEPSSIVLLGIAGYALASLCWARRK
jgi:hypothetical protein